MAVHFKQGDRKSITVQVTDQMVRQFADMSGDHNPIHLDDNYAKTTRFGRRIAHGMICGALISRTLSDTLGDGGIYLGQTLKFLHPIFIDDTITIELHVANFREERGIGLIETVVKKQNGEVAVKGEATIMTGDVIQAKK
jgi:acyl dehydratase